MIKYRYYSKLRIISMMMTILAVVVVYSPDKAFCATVNLPSLPSVDSDETSIQFHGWGKIRLENISASQNEISGLYGEPLEEGGIGGELDDKYAWRGSVSVYEEPESPELNDDGVMPYHVVVQVYWSEGNTERFVSMETLRLGVPEFNR